MVHYFSNLFFLLKASLTLLSVWSRRGGAVRLQSGGFIGVIVTLWVRGQSGDVTAQPLADGPGEKCCCWLGNCGTRVTGDQDVTNVTRHVNTPETTHWLSHSRTEPQTCPGWTVPKFHPWVHQTWVRLGQGNRIRWGEWRDPGQCWDPSCGTGDVQAKFDKTCLVAH